MSAHLASNRAAPDTAIARAMGKAGHRTPYDRLIELADCALDRHGSDYRAARDAFAALVRDDAQLLWELFAPQREGRLIEFLRDLADARRRAEPVGREPDRVSGAVHCSGAGNAGHPMGDRPTRPTVASPAAVAAVAPAPVTPRLPGQPRDPTLVLPKPRLNGAKPAVIAAMEAERLKSKLYTFLVNGRPIAEVTAREAREWANAKAHQAWFVNLLTEGVPDDMLVGKCRTPEEADAMYARAEVATRGR